MPKTFQFFKWSGKRAVAFFVLAVIVSLATIGTTLAYIIIKTAPIENEFTPPTVEVIVNNGSSQIVNNSDIPVYTRAAVVANWLTDEGKVYSLQPVAGTDYEISMNNTEWFLGSDGFYYYAPALAAGEEAADLVTNVTPITALPAGYTLRIQIISSVIQSTPADAIANWPAVEITDGKLTAK